MIINDVLHVNSFHIFITLQDDLPIGLKGNRHSLVDQDMSIKVNILYLYVL